MKDIVYFIIAGALFILGIYLWTVTLNHPASTQTTYSVGIQTIGIASKAGCLKTNYSDIDLLKNAYLMQKIGHPVQLCYLKGGDN